MRIAIVHFTIVLGVGIAACVLYGCRANKGSCTTPEDCACPCGDEAAPVCTPDGTQYLNQCMLECDGQTLGVCPPPLALCSHTCTGAADCGNAADWQCVSGACKPVVTPECTTTDECRIAAAGWIAGNTACNQDSDCGGGGGPNSRVCIVYGGKHWCAKHNCNAPDTLSVPKAQDATVTVDVCWDTTHVCEEGACFEPCTADVSCAGDAAYPHCDLTTGHCVCNSTSCTGQVDAPVCLASGVCGCAADADCTAPGTDTCYSGVCGCSAVSVCTALDTAASWACQ